MIRRTMPFGKYRGRPLDAIPESYLRWVLRECDTDEDILSAIRTELANRPGQLPCLVCGQWPGQTPLLDVPGIIARWQREVVLEHHPDRGGDLRTMQALNSAADRLHQMWEEAAHER